MAEKEIFCSIGIDIDAVDVLGLPRPSRMLPLEGMTVVSLEQAVAAPFATRQLADQR